MLLPKAGREGAWPTHLLALGHMAYDVGHGLLHLPPGVLFVHTRLLACMHTQIATTQIITQIQMMSF